MKQAEVVFCGNSLYLSMLAAGLQQVEQLRISLVEVSIDKAMKELKMLHPHPLIVNYVPNFKR